MKILNDKCALKCIENALTCHYVWDVELIKIFHLSLMDLSVCLVVKSLCWIFQEFWSPLNSILNNVFLIGSN